MTAKVLYFFAGNVPTNDELAEVAAIEAAARPYEVLQRSAVASSNYGEGRPEEADFVAGSPPAAYDEVPVIDPDNIPAVVLTDEQVVVSDGDELEADDGGTIAVAVVDGVATYTYTPAP